MEPLHEDLVDYVTDGLLHHPMLIDSCPNETARINQLYRQKMEELEKAEADRDWSAYVFLHERPYRLQALLDATEIGLADDPSNYWKLVGHVWTDTENIFQNLEEWRQVWGSTVDGRRACMLVDDLSKLISLPEQIEVWRGTGHRDGADGLSWTLDQEKAIWFARRFRSGDPLLVNGVVKKKDVLAYFGARNEQTIVSMGVSIISVAEIGPAPKST